MQCHWIELEDVLETHEEQLREFGGPSGILDEGSLQSALANPKWILHFSSPDTPPTLARLAASYIVSLARNHGFADGNKRTAWVIGNMFLSINGAALRVETEDAINTVLGVAAGEISEEQLEEWISRRLIVATDFGFYQL
ncbi:type II toxin-antitoxin system death-on-curing family toxin [Labrys sp. La1]|uniref:type II toxin-antitoxin system death-on-curing family toxin n=1 Tax=Labrys sp. La1 TaxID=3404917 RepID=UPI003EB6952E